MERLAPDPAVDAARMLYERHGAAVLRFCRSRLRSREEAEDARQTTFLYAFRALSRGVEPVSEVSWLLKIAENVCRSRRRAASRRLAFEVAEDPQALGRVAAPARPDVELLMPLEDALGRLTESQRRALLLREWHGLSYREIGAQLGVGPGAVDVLLFRARRALADELDAPGRSRRRARGLDLAWLPGVAKQLVGGTTMIAGKSALAAVAVAVAVAASTVAVSLGRGGPGAAKPAAGAPAAAARATPDAVLIGPRPAPVPPAPVRAASGQTIGPRETPQKTEQHQEPTPLPASTPRAPTEPAESPAKPTGDGLGQVVEASSPALPPLIDDVSSTLEPVAETATKVVAPIAAAADELAETATAATEPEPLPATPALP